MQAPATDTTITTIENRVRGLLADKLTGPTTAIATNKYLGNDNRLVYLTVCTVAESAIPQVRIQVFERVPGGVNERSYALFNDRRFEVSTNPMIFGQTPTATEVPQGVDEATAQAIIVILDSLSHAQQS